MSKPVGETGVRYLNIDYKKKYGSDYVVRVSIAKKHFVVWSGNDKQFGTMVAKKVLELMNQGKGVFLDWFDNDREEWLMNANPYENQ